MKQIAAVFRNQSKVFLRDKGMIVFYLLAAIVIGIAVPFFGKGMQYSFSFAALMTATFLTPLLADGMAGEREKKTLESLLSTAIKGSCVVWGKFLFSMLFASVFFSLCVALTVVTYTAFGIETGFSGFLWICAGLLALMNFATTVLGGLYQSSLSGDTRMAYSKVSLIAFPMGILYMVALTALTVVGTEESLSVLMIFLVIYGILVTLFAVMIVRLRQHTYFQKVRLSKKSVTQRLRMDEPRSHSQVSAVFAHEMRYVAKLKMLMLMFALLCAAPAVMCISCYAYFGNINLNLAVLVTALMVPVVLSAVMLAISSVLTMVGVNIVGGFFEGGVRYLYSADQLVQLFPASLLACVSMVLITGVLSARMKRPRSGLYVSSILGFLFIIPPLCIMYLTENALFWSMIYCAVMLIANVISLIMIARNISRPQLMRWI